MFILPLLLTACGDDDGGNDNPGEPEIRHPEDFLPEGTEGMPKDGANETATDLDGLKGIVNGGFELYSDNGFEEMASQLYSGTVGGAAASIAVWVIDVGTAENATALFVELQQTYTLENGGELGDQDLRDTSGLFAYTLWFREAEYVSRLLISGSNSQDAKDLVLLFGAHIDQEISE